MLLNDPGITSESMVLATVHVDGDDPRNITPKAALEEGEQISLLEVEVGALLPTLDRLAGLGMGVDSRLYSLAFGMSRASLKSDIPSRL